MTLRYNAYDTKTSVIAGTSTKSPKDNKISFDDAIQLVKLWVNDPTKTNGLNEGKFRTILQDDGINDTDLASVSLEEVRTVIAYYTNPTS